MVTTGRAKYGNCSKWFPLGCELETEEERWATTAGAVAGHARVINVLADHVIVVQKKQGLNVLNMYMLTLSSVAAF